MILKGFIGDYFLAFFTTILGILPIININIGVFMKIYLLVLFFLTSLASAKTEDPNSKLKIEALKCIRSITELKIDPYTTVPISYLFTLNLANKRDNDFEISELISECQNSYTQLKTLERVKKKKFNELKKRALSEFDDTLPESYNTKEKKAFNLVYHFYIPSLLECTVAGVTLNAAAVVGVGGGIGLGTCKASNGRIYQGMSNERIISYGVGAFAGVYAGKIEMPGERYTDGVSIALGGGISGSYGPVSYGVGAILTYNDSIVDTHRGFKIKNTNFKELIEKLDQI